MIATDLSLLRKINFILKVRPMSHADEKNAAEDLTVDPNQWEIAPSLPAAIYDDNQDKQCHLLNPLSPIERRWIRRQYRAR